MLSLLKDPLVKIGAFIIMYIIVSGLWADQIKAWGIYMAFLAFMLVVSMIIPDSIDISSPAIVQMPIPSAPPSAPLLQGTVTML